MNDFNYDSYCGIYCGACDIMMAYKTGETYKLASFWNESTVRMFQYKSGMHPDKNRPYSGKCHGCKTDTLFTNCDACKIRACAIAKNIGHCIECTEYPCGFISEVRKAGVFLPHIKTNHQNMETIARIGVAEWLKEQDDAWQCPECKTGFSWYTGRCRKCGKNLKNYSFKFSRFKMFLLKLGIYVVPAKK